MCCSATVIGWRTNAGFCSNRRTLSIAFYCLPGVEGAHEKGGVEGEGGRFRRNHLVPVPEVDSLAELNATLASIDEAEDQRRINGRLTTIGQDFAIEAPLLRSLPNESFEPGLLLTPRAYRHARITVRNCRDRTQRRSIRRVKAAGIPRPKWR